MPQQQAASQELISEDIQEIISYRPHWIVRKGSFIFLLVVLFLLAFTWIIKYPDTINTSARIVAQNPPKHIAAKTEGKLLKLFVANEQEVKKGDVLAYIESSADYSHIIKLRDWVHKTVAATDSNSFDCLLKDPLPYLVSLGELQTSYQKFQNEFATTKQTLANGYFQQKRGALHKDLNYIASLRKNTTQQQELQEQDKTLQQKELEAYEKLAADKVIAPLELDQYKSKLLAKEQSVKQTGTQITNADISGHSMQKELLDLQKQVLDQQQQFRSALLILKSEIETWVQQYILTTPEDGKVLFVSSLQENEWIANGQGLFYVQPEQIKYHSELMAGQQGLGKIKVGQKVLIKVKSYPSTEYGHFTGTIDYISLIPSRSDSFLIKVGLPNGLRTSYNNEIFFRNDLLAQAEIITDSRRLFDRLTGQLKKIGGQ